MIARGKTRVLKTKEVGVPIPPGAMFLVESMGGGGYGPPGRRTPEARASDRVNGFVSGRARRRRS
jgi:N-methylhydantoinase B